MARTTGPLLSMDASGSVGNSITFAKWKGRNYVRRYAIPANPRSTAQISIRAAMQLYTSMYSAYTSEVIAAYDTIAQSLKISPFNAYTRAGLKAWKSTVIITPDGDEAPGGNTTTSLSLDGNAEPRGITWSWGETLSGSPVGWVLCVREAGDPGLETQYAAFGSASATSWLQTGLKPATAYQGRINALMADGTYYTKAAAVTVTTP